MRCVKCPGELHSKETAGVVVDQCDRCDGIWFDPGELERVLKGSIDALRARTAEARTAAPEHDSHRGACPRCQGQGLLVQVVSRQREHLHLDTCSVCFGTWLDGGELEAIKEPTLLQRLSDRLAKL